MLGIVREARAVAELGSFALVCVVMLSGLAIGWWMARRLVSSLDAVRMGLVAIAARIEAEAEAAEKREAQIQRRLERMSDRIDRALEGA